jgi:hypothetical protein
MSMLTRQITIEAPADAVWDLVGRRFDRIGDWATAIPASTAIVSTPSGAAPTRIPAAATPADAPVAGWVCHTGIRLLPEVTETIVAYDDTARTLTYPASGLPAFVATARNTWTVTPLDERRTRVCLHAQFDTRGMLGVLARWAILIQVGRTSRHLPDDLRHYLEHGTPSPRKQNQLRRTRP